MSDDVVAQGREAWQRIKGRDKATFNDWLDIGAALMVGRSWAMKTAKVNRPYGPRYQHLISAWLAENGLADLDSHERRNAIVMVEHRSELEAWRAGLSDVERRRCNHPNSVLGLWSKRQRPRPPGPRRRTMSDKPRGRPVWWSGEMIRRGAMAMRASGSTDLFIMARACLEAAIRNDADVAELLDKPRSRAKPPAAADVEMHAA